MHGEVIIHGQNFLLQLYHCFFFNIQQKWLLVSFPFVTKLLRLLNSTTVSIHNLLRLSCNRVVSKAHP